ncbi:MAG: hypothetical protein H0T42_04280 [Deltaproteobacteria bacterium]|nr:hypothetical protein [Deltaproteobacteria bacterium]
MGSRPAPPSLAPFIFVGVIALAPLLFLSAAAAGGGSWRWLEYPRTVTLIAFALGMFACSRKDRTSALLVPIGTVALAALWNVAMARSTSAGNIVASTMQTLAPWLVGSLYGVLSVIAISRPRQPRLIRILAGVWLCAVGIVAAVLTLENRSWLTLENFDNSHTTYRSSVSWPDTKMITLVLACSAAAFGALIVALGLRKPASLLPRATIVRD